MQKLYAIFHKSDLVYIGITNRTLKKRFLEHLKLSRLNKGYVLHKFIALNNIEDFTIEEIISGCFSKEEICDLEKQYIKKFRPKFNRTSGGQFGYISKEHYENLSKKLKGRIITWGDKISKTKTGKKLEYKKVISEQGKKNMSEAKKKFLSEHPDFVFKTAWKKGHQGGIQFKKGIIPWNKGKKETRPDVLLKISKYAKKRKRTKRGTYSEEHKHKIRQKNLQRNRRAFICHQTKEIFFNKIEASKKLGLNYSSVLVILSFANKKIIKKIKGYSFEYI